MKTYTILSTVGPCLSLPLALIFARTKLILLIELPLASVYFPNDNCLIASYLIIPH